MRHECHHIHFFLMFIASISRWFVVSSASDLACSSTSSMPNVFRRMSWALANTSPKERDFAPRTESGVGQTKTRYGDEKPAHLSLRSRRASEGRVSAPRTGPDERDCSPSCQFPAQRRHEESVHRTRFLMLTSATPSSSSSCIAFSSSSSSSSVRARL